MMIIDSKIMSRLKKRDEKSNKKDNGTLLAVCGSERYRGAAVIAAAGGLRSGVGLYYAASPECVLSALNQRFPEAVLLPMQTGDFGNISYGELSKILIAAERSTAILCGCGIGISSGVRFLIKGILENTKVPIILDADALNIVSENTDILEYGEGRCIITPHFGEMARLTGKRYDQIKSDPERIAVEFSERYGCVTVLKGSSVYIAVPGADIAVYSNPNSGLAKGGSGDFLAGIIASLAAQGNDTSVSAYAGVYIHGQAAAFTRERLCRESMLATDVADDIYKVFRMSEG